MDRLVSVIVPTYNREEYLRVAIDSVLAQTYRNWELIVVDDGSTDGTRACLARLADPRVRVILREHCGNAAVLRNAGARGASGDYLAFLDSDDLWLPTKLELQMREALAVPDCGWGYTALGHIDGWGRETGGPRHWTPQRGWILAALVEGRAMVQTSTVVVRRSLFEAAGGFDETLIRCQDYDLWLRLAGRSPAAVVAAPVVLYRQHEGNARRGWLDTLSFMNRIYARLLARTASPRLRRLCRRQRVRVTLDIVAKSRAAGLYRDARRALRISFPYSWWHPVWWIALGKTLARPMIPGAMLARYHGARTGNS